MKTNLLAGLLCLLFAQVSTASPWTVSMTLDQADIETGYQIDISDKKPEYGSPTSQIDHESSTKVFGVELGTESDRGHLWTVHLGVSVGEMTGEMRDRDWWSEQEAQSRGEPTLFSDTTSQIEEGHFYRVGLRYAQRDWQDDDRLNWSVGVRMTSSKHVSQELYYIVASPSHYGTAASPGETRFEGEDVLIWETHWVMPYLEATGRIDLFGPVFFEYAASVSPFGYGYSKDRHLKNPNFDPDSSMEVHGLAAGASLNLGLGVRMTDVELTAGYRGSISQMLPLESFQRFADGGEGDIDATDLKLLEAGVYITLKVAL